MKRNIWNICLALLVMVLVTGCYDDKGNYSYDQLLEIEITGLVPDKEYTAFAAEPFQIPITVEVKNGDLSDLSYEWKLEGEVISTEKDLNVIADFPSKPNLAAQLDVIDNKTGVRHITLFTISVSSAVKSGWLILSDLGDKSQLSFMRNDNVFMDDVYYLRNNEYLSAGAYAICEHWLPWSAELGQIFVACQQGPGYSVELDGNSFLKMINTKDEFVDGAPEDFCPQSMDCVMNWDYLISAGKLYTREQPNGMDAHYQEGAFPNFPLSGDYELLPWTIQGNIYFNPDVLAFDKRHCSYVLLRDGTMREFNYTSDPTKAFNPSNMDKMLLGGAAMNVGSSKDEFITFLKDMNSNKIYVQKFKFTGYRNRKYSSISEVEFPDPSLILEDTKFAICIGRKYVYFTSGKNLYVYNHEDNLVSLLREFPTKIREIALCATNYERLAIAVENAGDASKSDFMILDVSVVGKGQLVEGTEVKGKCGRVVDILYKVGDQGDIMR